MVHLRRNSVGVVFELMVVMGALLVASQVVATNSPDETDAVPTTPALGSERSPMFQEIEAAFDAQKLGLVELQTRLEAATDGETTLAIMQEIGDLKQDTELQILGIQARYARAAGKTEAAERLEAAMAYIQNPPRVAPAENGEERRPVQR